MNMREKKNRTLSPVECFGGRWPAANNNRTNIDGIESMLELHDLQHIWRIWIWITCNFYPFSFFISVCFAFFILLSILNFNVIVFDRQWWDRQSPIHTHLWRFYERSYWQPLIIHFFIAFVLLAIHTTQYNGHTQIQRSQRRRSNKTTNDTVADDKQTQIIKKCSTFGSFIFVGHLAFSLLLTHPNCDAPRWSIYIYLSYTATLATISFSSYTRNAATQWLVCWTTIVQYIQTRMENGERYEYAHDDHDSWMRFLISTCICSLIIDETLKNWLIARKREGEREENMRLERLSFELRRLEQKKAIERAGEGNIQYMINALLLLLYY